MKTTLFIVSIACLLSGCSQPPPPAPQVDISLMPKFEAEFDRLFLSQEPLRYQDNVQFLSSIQKGQLSPEELELVRVKLRAFLSATPKTRPYAPDSEHTGISSEMSFLRLQAVQVLAETGTKGDAAFIRGLDAKAEAEHPVFDEECQRAIKILETR